MHVCPSKVARMIHPDTVLHRGRIYTVDACDTVAEAVAIQNGWIVAIGTSQDVLAFAGPGTRRIDLEGRAVLPGFVDGHPHMDGVGIRLLKPSFDGVRSIDEVLDIVRREVGRRKPGEWIICNPVASEPEFFAFPGVLREGRWPNRYDLDKVSPGNPVFIEPSGLIAPGIGIANSAAIKIAGITSSTETPPGVEIDKDSAGEAGMHAFNRAGVTAIYEGHGIPRPQQRAYSELWRQGKLSVRTYFVVAFPQPYFLNVEQGQALIDETALYAAGEGFG